MYLIEISLFLFYWEAMECCRGNNMDVRVRLMILNFNSGSATYKLCDFGQGICILTLQLSQLYSLKGLLWGLSEKKYVNHLAKHLERDRSSLRGGHQCHIIIVVIIGLCFLDFIFFVIINWGMEKPRFIIWIFMSGFSYVISSQCFVMCSSVSAYLMTRDCHSQGHFSHRLSYLWSQINVINPYFHG